MRYARAIASAWVAIVVVVGLTALTAPSAHATFPGANGKLVFDGGSAYNNIYTANADGTGLNRILHNGYVNWQATWSPDGTKIAFASNMHGGANRQNDNFNIYVMNADGSSIVQITRGPDTTWQPAWSPDGARIAYSTDRSGYFHIWYKTLATGVNTQVTTGHEMDYVPDWSPDGAKVAFSRVAADNEDIWVKTLAGGSAARLTTNKAIDSWPSWSPDGTQIAFNSNRAGNVNIYTMKADGTSVVQRTTNKNFDAFAVWSPDGTQIAFTSGRTGHRNIWILTLTGGVKQVTKTTTAYFEQPDWQTIPV